MTPPRSRLLWPCAALACGLSSGVASPAGGHFQSHLAASTEQQIALDIARVPCANDQRLESVVSLFSRAGAAPADMATFSYKDTRNLVVRKAGTSTDVIVVGAHYDKVPAGCGALDNWTGIVTMAHVYSTIRPVALEKTVLFVAFGDEEKGLVGSTAMAEGIPKEARRQYCAMINIDSLGLAIPQVLDNASSAKLRTLTGQLAHELNLPFQHARVLNADADSTPFLREQIPAVTIHGLSRDWPLVLHTGKDQATKVNANSVYLGYRLALALLNRLNAAACDAFR